MADPMIDPSAADPAADPAASDDAGSGGYEICIQVKPDGTMSVGTGPIDPAEATESMSPASSIREAMAMAMDIYKNNGEAPDGSDDADFQSGYGKPAAPTIQKQSNEDMA